MSIEIKPRRICQKLAFFMSLGLVFILSPEAFAHDFWIEQSGKELVLIFGHGEQREDFDISRVKTAKAFSPRRGEIEVRREKKGKGLALHPLDPAAWIFVEIDNGYWSKTIYGWKNLPKRKASRVVEANRSFCYAKALMAWDDALQRPANDVRLDLVLGRNPFEMRAGDSLPFKVFFKGQSLAGVGIEGRDHETVATTDRDGNAKVRLVKGRQLLSVNHKEAVKDDPDADFVSYAATLTFEVEK